MWRPGGASPTRRTSTWSLRPPSPAGTRAESSRSVRFLNPKHFLLCAVDMHCAVHVHVEKASLARAVLASSLVSAECHLTPAVCAEMLG